MNNPKTCPTCDNPMVYSGVDDGGGDYGTAVCDVWSCQNCMQDFEFNCIDDVDHDGEDDEAWSFDDDGRDDPMEGVDP